MEEQLGVLAEISVGLAGFSSVIVIFRRQSADGTWKPEDAFRFGIMLQSALVAGFFAILPAAITGLGFAAGQLWPFLSAILLSYLLFDAIRSGMRFGRLPSGSLSGGLAVAFLTTNLGVIGIQLLNIAGWLVPRGPGPYLFGVTWLTVIAGLMFYRLVMAPIGSSGSDDS